VLHREELPHPLASPRAATRLAGDEDQPADASLEVGELLGEGVKLTIPGDDAILIHIR
jgi:hypothetical protein